jgi:hypothetical protein
VNDDEFESDEELLARLRRIIARVDPVPTGVVAAARTCGAWRTIDTDLALLTYDSASQSNELVGVRGREGRLLTFTSDALTIDVEILPGGEGIVGEVDGPRNAHVAVHCAAGSLGDDTDDLGRFRVRDIPEGLMRLEITERETSRVTRTAWILV